MPRWIETMGYQLCWRPDRFSFWWSRLWYRYYCPYPTTDDYRARACVKAGLCGCNNLDRYAAVPPAERESPHA